MKLSRSMTLTVCAAVVAAPFLWAAPASASPSPTAALPSCLSVPDDPALSAEGTHVSTTARSTCGAPTVLWLVRVATPTQPRVVEERFVFPGAEASVRLDCRRSGTHSYEAVVWDPNMMFNRVSATVTLTC